VEAVEAWHRMMEPVIARSATLIERHIPVPGRLLDVGCGYGFFLHYMAQRGWRTQGIEISSIGRKIGRERFGIDVSTSSFPRSDWLDGSYDAISLFYVIEHLPDPIMVMKEAHRLLRPGGVLLLRWPHTTPIVKLMKPWVSSLGLYQAPSHLFDFSPPTIRKMLGHVGFKMIHTTICGWTRPAPRGARLASTLFGGIGETLARWSRDRFLLPGVSKTTVARR
jgi:SAM-dependent methyltransferase